MTPVREMANGRWRAILPAFGIGSGYLSGKHGPCPLCKEGTDRWRFDDKEGNGTWFCSKCGAGDGVKLAMLASGKPFIDVAKEVERLAGAAPAGPIKPKRDQARMREQMTALWRQALPLSEVVAASGWWVRRLGELPSTKELRAVPKLKYQDGLDGTVSWHPAMLARVMDAVGKPVNLHRTYLANTGLKADVPKPRKITSGVTLPHGSAVRLSAITEHLGIAEGIETALAASKLFDLPCWAALNASNLERWSPPEGVNTVTVFGDNDEAKRFTGQRAAYALADRLAGQGLSVQVRIPTRAGDWNDELLARAPDLDRRTA